jgi:hypothetical protein
MLIVARLALAIRVCLRLRLSRRNGSVHDLVKIGQRGVVLAGCRDNSDSTPSTGTCSCSSSRSAISTICSLARFSVPEPRVYDELVQQEQADVVIPAVTAHLEWLVDHIEQPQQIHKKNERTQPSPGFRPDPSIVVNKSSSKISATKLTIMAYAEGRNSSRWMW